MMSFLSVPTILVANPHFYDYRHSFKFDADGGVEMVDGAGQAFNTLAKGHYRIVVHDAASAEFEFLDLVELNPYQEKKKVRDIDAFRIRVTKETGVFAFCREVVWRIPDKTKWPCILYHARYICSDDPLAFGRANQAQNLYYMIERRELIESAKTYYAREDCLELTVEELLQKGITPLGFEHIGYGQAPEAEKASKPWWRFWA
ncbi:MAG: hypothetical protein ACJ76Y_02975 [Thermoanaerobaculia bacterium]